MANPQGAVEVHGLRELRRDLRAIDRTLPRELSKDMKAAAEGTVLPAAKQQAPRRTGRLADSLKVSVRATSVAIRSPLPYAQPIHWGWPRRNIRANPFIERAIEEKGEALVDALGDGIEELARRHGFNK